jgi:hypothetical protein
VALFLAWIEGYLEFFMGELGGTPSTPSEIYKMAVAQQPTDGIHFKELNERHIVCQRNSRN